MAVTKINIPIAGHKMITVHEYKTTPAAKIAITTAHTRRPMIDEIALTIFAFNDLYTILTFHVGVFCEFVYSGDQFIDPTADKTFFMICMIRSNDPLGAELTSPVGKPLSEHVQEATQDVYPL